MWTISKSYRDISTARWKEEFAAAGDGTSHPDMSKIRYLRKVIFEQTRAYCIDRFPDPVTSVKLLSAPHEESSDNIGSVNGTAAIVRVDQIDMLTAAEQLVSAGHRVGVLNMACASTPGGGVKWGAGAQEENLHRRTDLFRWTMGEQKQNYPLGDTQCLCSDPVRVLRGPEHDGYAYLPREFEIAVVTCAAVDMRTDNMQLTEDRQYADPLVEELMKSKIRLILDGFREMNCTAAVVSAFGCGAFGNPPDVVAGLFRQVLLSNDMAVTTLRTVVFAVFDDHNAGGWHNPSGNFLPFKDAFEDLAGNVDGAETHGPAAAAEAEATQQSL